MKKPNRTPLAVGDRCRVYGHVAGIQLPEGGLIGTVVESAPTAPASFVTVDFPEYGGYRRMYKWVHPKQCRRLKPRPAKTQEKRAEVFAAVFADNTWIAYRERDRAQEIADKAKPQGRVAHLIELHPGEIPLSRDALREAFGKASEIQRTEHVSFQTAVAKALGLGDLK